MVDGTLPIAGLLEALRRADRPTLVLRPEPASPPASVALLAGSFDPLTVGHAAMAGAAARLAELVVLVYSVRTLPKEHTSPPPLLDEENRVAALERFCRARGYAAGLCSHGLLADQVEAADELFPEAELLVVVGSDKLLQLLDPRWYENVDATLEALFSRASVTFAMRSGDAGAVADAIESPAHAGWAPWSPQIRELDIDPAVAAVSSRDVRARIARGDDVSALVPEEFLRVIVAR